MSRETQPVIGNENIGKRNLTFEGISGNYGKKHMEQRGYAALWFDFGSEARDELGRVV
jgi:hypothetical protein